MARLRFPALAALLLLALIDPRASTAPALPSLNRFPQPRPAEATLSGVATVTDGDTLRIGATRIRLFGVDAPEAHQRCLDSAGRDWACGTVAAERLKSLVARRVVVCNPQDTDRYGRTVASCSVDGRDLGATIVSEGLARAYERYSDRYLGDEAGARASGLGLWQADSEAPWDWRRDRSKVRTIATTPGSPIVDTPTTGNECTIKGNISRDGRKLYHTPDMASWSRTKIDFDRGERLFCDEAAALAAGWVPASGRGR